MPEPIRSAVVVGGGSAGFLAALTFRRMLPQIKLAVVHSPDIPIIGVGESTTPAVPVHLHEHLGIDRNEFHKEVRPSWKLGLRFEWGAKDVPHFNYTFDGYLDKRIEGLSKWNAFYCLHNMRDASTFNAIMDRNRSPATMRNGRLSLDPRATYHIPNASFIDFLERKSVASGAELIADQVVGVERNETGGVKSLMLAGGRKLEADLFVDCSGFGSILLGKTLEEPYISYRDALYCDRAVVGSWSRADFPEDDTIRPYTTMTTMKHGWCWRIDFEDAVTRGYVYSSQFCSEEEAEFELRALQPQLAGADLRVLKFPSGRRERYVVENVVAVGNASGFVEPLEATSLHLIIEQLYNLTWALTDSDRILTDSLRNLLNERFASTWDDVRDFLALHYKYNEHQDTPFWRHCRAESPLGSLEDMVDHYAEVGPSRLLARLTSNATIFGYGGYASMLLGLRVPTTVKREITHRERQRWDAYRKSNAVAASQTLQMRQALNRAYRG